MLNLDIIETMWAEPVFKPARKKKTVRRAKNPKPKTIALVMNALKDCKTIKRDCLIKKTGLSKCTIKTVMAAVIAKGEATEELAQLGRDRWSVYTIIKDES